LTQLHTFTTGKLGLLKNIQVYDITRNHQNTVLKCHSDMFEDDKINACFQYDVTKYFIQLSVSVFVGWLD